MKKQAIPTYECVLKKSGVLRVSERKLCSSTRAADAARAMIGNSPGEKIAVLYLNSAAEIIGAEVVAAGGIGGASIRGRELVRGAVLANAAAVILTHNHPSGMLSPSGDDMTMTEVAVQAFRLMGITVLDHVIVTNGPGYYSFTEAGKLPA